MWNETTTTESLYWSGCEANNLKQIANTENQIPGKLNFD